MRADRLVATLLVLQRRGRVTAAELAEVLEVSERTARRDLESLAMAGVPVYPVRGRGGGWSLIGGARTDLSGLSASEARALFLVAGPSSQATPEVKAALRKLVRALPETMRDQAEAAASAVILDPSSWDKATVPPPPLLEDLQRAVVDGVQVRIDYAGRDRPAGTRLVHPLGLVVKAAVWYLIADTDKGLRTFRVSRVRAVERTADAVVRPDGFDLAETWRSIVVRIDERRASFTAVVRVTDANVIGWLRGMFGTRVRALETRPDGTVDVEVRGHSAHVLAGELAEFGSHVEAIAPLELRAELARLGADLVRIYG